MMVGRAIVSAVAFGLMAVGIFVGIGADSLNGARLIAAPILILSGFGLYARMLAVAARSGTNEEEQN